MSGSGWTTTSSLEDSLDQVASSARSVREYEGVMSQLVENRTLGVGMGLEWRELTYAQLTAQAVTETTELNNPQQITDTEQTITPTLAAVETFITDRVGLRISPAGNAQIGSLGQKALQRKKDEDGLTVLNSGTTTSEPGAGSTLASGFIAAAQTNIASNTTEGANPPFAAVLHGFQQKDLYDELVAGVGTYILTDGPTARVFSGSFMLPISNTMVATDNNITIDSADDAPGGVFAKEGIVLVQGRAARIVAERNEARGGGGFHVYHYDEYAYGQRLAIWVYRMKSDATAPTS